MHRAADEAYYAYRERRLRDRYGPDDPDGGILGPRTPSPTPSGGDSTVPASDRGGVVDASLNIIELAEAASTELPDALPAIEPDDSAPQP